MKKLLILFVLISNLSFSQSIQAWVGTPYYVGLENHLNYQAGAMAKINKGNNNFGLGIEYATKNVFKYNEFTLPQLNLLLRYEHKFILNDKNNLGLNAGATVNFRNNSYFDYSIEGFPVTLKMDNGIGASARAGFSYNRVLSQRISLFGEVFGQYKLVQDLTENVEFPAFRMNKNPRDFLTLGLNIGIEINLSRE